MVSSKTMTIANSSGSGEGSPKRRRLHDGSADGKPDDDVPLSIDVGGTLFRVSRTTLTNSSAYFESMLSARWTNDESDKKDVLFVDQDPSAFDALLTYMRSGIVHLPRQDDFMAKKILILAEFLGVNGFLVSVKATTMKNIYRRDECLSDEITEAAEFDSRFGNTSAAVDKGILPCCFFPPSDDLAIRVVDRVFHASKTILVEKSAYFSRLLTSAPDDYWKQEITLHENPDVTEVVLQMLGSPNSAFTSMTEKFNSVGTDGQNAKFRHFYVQAILTLIDKLHLPVDFRDNCVQTITHTFNA